jgi:glycine/D-amino acid oxidase-like deaminating enzyme
MHAVVLGGGAIGLSVAWHLLPHARVTVVDVPKPGAASPASAGMLAPFAESKAPGPLLDLGVESLRMWPAFAAQLGVTLHGPGTLHVADGSFVPEEKNVDPRELLAALRPHLHIVHEPVEGDVTVIAKGAWSAPWSFPVRGQLISLRSDAVETTIYAPGVYLIPRNGQVIVGSTEEHVGFELGTPPSPSCTRKPRRSCPRCATPKSSTPGAAFVPDRRMDCRTLAASTSGRTSPPVTSATASSSRRSPANCSPK